MTVADDRFHDIRYAVPDLCREFPDEHLSKLDEQRAYPAEFVDATLRGAMLESMVEWTSYPQLKARRRWTEVDTPAGPVPALLPPGVPDAATTRMDPVPALGQHTDTILRELDDTSGQIAAMRGARAI